MKDPLLYRIGIDKTCYSWSLLCQWISYGFIQAFIIYFSCLRVFFTPGVTINGKDQGFWVGGHVAYLCITIKTNVVLMV